MASCFCSDERHLPHLVYPTLAFNWYLDTTKELVMTVSNNISTSSFSLSYTLIETPYLQNRIYNAPLKKLTDRTIGFNDMIYVDGQIEAKIGNQKNSAHGS
jgi:hypothetical protein